MNKKILNRLKPFYIATFFESFVLWYAIEKPFMRLIGMDDSAIGLSLSIMLAVSIVLEVPSGILSDKWSRKGTQQLGYISLLVCAVLGYFSDSFLGYTIAISFWGIYWAMASGVGESIVYDILLEEKEDTENFEKYLGRRDIIATAALVLGSMSSSLVAGLSDNLRLSYILTVPFMLAALVSIQLFKEPVVHKANQESSLTSHIKQTFSEVLRQPKLYILVATMVTAGLIARIVFEFVQIWWIPLGVSLFWYGPLNSFVQGAVGVGGFLAPRLKNKKIAWATGLITIASILLTIANVYLATAAQFLVLSITLTLGIVLAKRLNDNLSSEVRAGAGSVIGFLINLVSIIFLALFGYLSDKYTVFSASWLIFVLMIVITAGLAVEYGLFAKKKAHRS